MPVSSSLASVEPSSSIQREWEQPGEKRNLSSDKLPPQHETNHLVIAAVAATVILSMMNAVWQMCLPVLSILPLLWAAPTRKVPGTFWLLIRKFIYHISIFRGNRLEPDCTRTNQPQQYWTNFPPAFSGKECDSFHRRRNGSDHCDRF